MSSLPPNCFARKPVTRVGQMHALPYFFGGLAGSGRTSALVLDAGW